MKEELEELRKEFNAKIDELLDKDRFVGKDKLVVGNWYIHIHGAMVNYQGGDKGYGFDSCGNWISSTWTFETYPEYWSPCPIEKFEAALKKETERRGYKEGVKIESFAHEILVGFTDKGRCGLSKDGFWYKGSIVMKAGKWAKIIPKEEDIFIGDYKVHFRDTYVVIDGTDYFKEFFTGVQYLLNCSICKIYLDHEPQTQLTPTTVNKILDRLK